MKVVLTGGGTGGHIFPALSLWKRMRETSVEDIEVTYIGTEAGLERDIVTRTGLVFVPIDAAPLRREFSAKAIHTLFLTWRGYRQAKRVLAELQPDVVIGTGGYVTLPVVFAAKSLGIPVLIWEGNARPGLTNQLCARRAQVVALSFAEGRRFFQNAQEVVVTGNPRASEVLHIRADALNAARTGHGILPHQKVIVLFFGSRGAETVNAVISSLIPELVARASWRVLFITGEKHFEALRQSIGALPAHLSLHPFIHNLQDVLPMTNLLVSRAGSSTLAEICALGIPSILIPSPYVTANHQEENAMSLVNAGAALMIREAELTPERLLSAMEEALSSPRGGILADKARSISTPNAVDDLVAIVERIRRRP